MIFRKKNLSGFGWGSYRGGSVGHVALHHGGRARAVGGVASHDLGGV